MRDLDDILSECKKGNTGAAACLYNTFAARMFAVCLQYSRNKAEAEDNLQDGFIRVFTSLSQYRGKGSFEGWMRRIFINTALEKYRKDRCLQIVDTLPDMEANDITAEDVNLPASVLCGFVDELPEKYKLVFNLYVSEELTHKEIAQMLGISEGTSKSNLSRAREILKRKIKEYLKNER